MSSDQSSERSAPVVYTAAPDRPAAAESRKEKLITLALVFLVVPTVVAVLLSTALFTLSYRIVVDILRGKSPEYITYNFELTDPLQCPTPVNGEQEDHLRSTRFNPNPTSVLVIQGPRWMIAEEELASRASVSSVKPDAGDHSQSRGRTLSRMLPLPPIQEVEEPFTAVLASLHTLHQFVKKPKRQSPKRPLRLKGQPHEPILSPLLEEDEPLSPTLPRTPLPAGAPAHDWSVGIHEDDSDDEYLSLRPSSSVTGDHYCYK